MSKTIHPRNIATVMEHALKYHVALPSGARLEGGARDLTDGERLALSYTHGVLVMLKGLGVDVDHVKIAFDDSEHEPA